MRRVAVHRNGAGFGTISRAGFGRAHAAAAGMGDWVIDMRAATPNGPRAGGRVVLLPVESRLQKVVVRPDPHDYSFWYERMLKDPRSGLQLARVLGEVCRFGPCNIVFGCELGKDRSGLLAAAVLEAVGAGQTYIWQDYAQASEAAAQIAELEPQRWNERGLTKSEYLQRFQWGVEPLQRLYERLAPGPGCILSLLDNHIPGLRSFAEKQLRIFKPCSEKEPDGQRPMEGK